MIRRFCPGLLALAIVAAIAVLPEAADPFARSYNPYAPNHSQASPAPAPADLVLTNARIETMDPAHEWASAVAIRGESIVAVSYAAAPAQAVDDPAIKPLVGPHTRIVDLRQQFVMPGFNDAHVHIGQSAMARLTISFAGVRSLAQFQQRIRESLQNHKPGEWITGFGWDQTLWPDKRDPTREDLDAVSTQNPMIFTRVDGHVAVANSLALKAAGITKDTPDPPGGRIRRDPSTGEPTGFLEEDAATGLVYSKIPPPTMEQRRYGIELVLATAARTGVTSLQDCSVLKLSTDTSFSPDNFLVYEQLRKEGKLTARITEWLDFTLPLPKLEELRSEWGSTDPWLKTGALKAFMDGSLGSRTAAMLAPYSDAPGTSGILRVDPDRLKAMAIERDRAGFQLAFHAIGDRGNRVALDTFAAVAAANGPRDRRDRVEHAQVVAPDDFARYGNLDVIASMQPSHLARRRALGRRSPGPGKVAWRLRLAHHGTKRRAPRFRHGSSRPAAQSIARHLCLRHAPVAARRSELGASGSPSRSAIACAPTR